MNTSLIVTTTTTTINVSRGGFIEQDEFRVVTSEKPDTVIGISVSTLSLFFTVATLLALFIGMACALYKRNSCLRKGNTKMRHCMSNNASKCCVHRRNRNGIRVGDSSDTVIPDGESLLGSEVRSLDSGVVV